MREKQKDSRKGRGKDFFTKVGDTIRPTQREKKMESTHGDANGQRQLKEKKSVVGRAK